QDHSIMRVGEALFVELLLRDEDGLQVGEVVLAYLCDASPGQVELVAIEVCKQGVEGHRDLAESPLVILAEGADPDAWKARREDGRGPVQVLEGELLVAAEVAFELLIGRRRAEIGPVEVLCIIRRPRLAIITAVRFAQLAIALGPRRVD